MSHKWVVVFIAAIVGLITLLIPLHITEDSLYYLNAADNIRNNEPMINYWENLDQRATLLIGENGSPFVAWPPLYPLLLSVLSANLINAISFSMIILFSAFLAGRTLGEDFQLLAALLAATSPALWHDHRHVWTEPLFIATIMAGLWLLTLFDSPQNKNGLSKQHKQIGMISLVVVLALCSLQRYIGVLLIGYSGLILLLRKQPLRAMLIIISVAPLALWLARNLAISGTLMGPRPPGEFALMDGIIVSIYDILTSLIVWGAVAIPISGIYIVVMKPNLMLNKSNFYIVSGWTILYLVVLFYLKLSTPFDSLQHRLLSPITITLFISMLGILGWRHAKHQPQPKLE